MVQSPSWAADWLAASQEIPRISRNPKVHYRTHKYALTLLVLNKASSVFFIKNKEEFSTRIGSPGSSLLQVPMQQDSLWKALVTWIRHCTLLWARKKINTLIPCFFMIQLNIIQSTRLQLDPSLRNFQLIYCSNFSFLSISPLHTSQFHGHIHTSWRGMPIELLNISVLAFL